MLQSTKPRLGMVASEAVCALALGRAPAARADYVKPTIHHAPCRTDGRTHHKSRPRGSGGSS